MARKRYYAYLPDGTRITRTTEKEYQFVVAATSDGVKWSDRGWRSTQKGAESLQKVEARSGYWKEIKIVRVAGITTLRDPKPQQRKWRW